MGLSKSVVIAPQVDDKSTGDSLPTYFIFAESCFPKLLHDRTNDQWLHNLSLLNVLSSLRWLSTYAWILIVKRTLFIEVMGGKVSTTQTDYFITNPGRCGFSKLYNSVTLFVRCA